MANKRVNALMLACLLGSLGVVCPSADATTATGVWVLTGSLNAAREYHTSTLLPNGDDVLATGGYAVGLTIIGTEVLSSAELYNLNTGVWTSTGSLNAARYLHTATLLPNKNVLVAGGYNNNAYLSSAELYNLTTGVWTSSGNLHTERYQHTATLLPDGTVLVVGGYNGAYLNSAELYNFVTGVWTLTGSLNTERAYHTATLLPDGNVLVAGGYNGAYLNSAELYNSGSGVWTLTGNLNAARQYHTATLLPNGDVLVAGGINSVATLDSAELYNPTTGVWTFTGSLTTARFFSTATLLPNGDVIVAGGLHSGYLSSAELYNLTTGVWTFTGSLNAARYADTATLLPNGNVLVAGGYNDVAGSQSLNSAELYIYAAAAASPTASATASPTASSTASSTASPTASASPSPTERTPLQVAAAWTTVGTASLSGQVTITHDVSSTKDCMIVPSVGPVMTGFTIVTSSASICCPHAGLFEQGNGQCTGMPCGGGTSVGTSDYAPRSTSPLQPGDGCILIDSACYDVSQNVTISLFQGSKFTGTATYASVTKRTILASSSATPLRDVFVYTTARGYEPAFLVSTATAEYGCVARGTDAGGTGCEIPWGCTTTTVSDYIYDASGSNCYALCYAP